MKKLEWIDGYGEVDDLTLSEVEKKLGIVFPDDYKECVKVNQGANPSLECFLVNGVERVFGALLGIIDLYNHRTDVLSVYNSAKNKLPKKVIPFGEDPAGNLICFDYRDCEENPVVVFWNHEGAWEKKLIMEELNMTEEEAEKFVRKNIFYVARTFTEFLEMLYADDE